MAETKITRWDPFRDLEQWHSLRPFGLRRMLDQVFEGESHAGGALAPAIDVVETDEHYLVTAEVPGVRKDDITIELHDGLLSIRGEKKSEREESREKARWLERTYGSFSRAMTLPGDADPEHVDARFQNGVLKITVAKRPEAKPKTIAIKN